MEFFHKPPLPFSVAIIGTRKKIHIGRNQDLAEPTQKVSNK